MNFSPRTEYFQDRTYNPVKIAKERKQKKEQELEQGRIAALEQEQRLKIAKIFDEALNNAYCIHENSIATYQKGQNVREKIALTHIDTGVNIELERSKPSQEMDETEDTHKAIRLATGEPETVEYRKGQNGGVERIVRTTKEGDLSEPQSYPATPEELTQLKALIISTSTYAD